jgi:hypothetical protein
MSNEIVQVTVQFLVVIWFYTTPFSPRYRFYLMPHKQKKNHDRRKIDTYIVGNFKTRTAMGTKD